MKTLWHEMVAMAPDDGGAAAGAVATDANAGANATGAETTAVAARPEILPETYWDGEKNAPKLDALLGDLSQAQIKAQQLDERLAKVPADPTGYQLTPSEKFKAPEGMGEFVIPPESALGKLVPQIAHKYGLPQEAMSELVDAYAQELIDGATAQHAAQQEDLKALGERASERIKTVETYLVSKLTQDEYAGIAGAITSSAGVIALEKLIASTGSIALVPGGGAPAGGKVDMTGWTSEQKLQHANEQAAVKKAASK
jgi:hypothetical protein